MAEIDAKTVMRLRQQTGAPMMDCKAALTEAGGDMDKAVDVLRKKGIKTAEGKAGREATEGLIFSYVHQPAGKIGVLVEVACESDFVARNEEFREFGRNIAMHIASEKPKYLKREDVPAATLEKEREIAVEQARTTMKGKPDQVVQKAAEGKLNAWLKQNVLLDQGYYKDDAITVDELTKQLIAKTGENLKIRRFVLFELGG